MRKKLNILLPIVVIATLLALGIVYVSQHASGVQVLNTKGIIGDRERGLMIFTALLSLVVVIPVFAMTFWIVWKYRAGNKKATYTPEADHNRVIETVWWGVPIVIISILAVVAWQSSHQLDPYQPLGKQGQSMTIQVVALDWKWLFIYPKEHVASVNFVEFPVNTPVNFEITADAPMNSLWIPQLGGQVYAMPGMSTELHLEASAIGDYHGSSANISGKGFAGMRFIARASSQKDYAAWLSSSQKSNTDLSAATYSQLAQPSENVQPATYRLSDDSLYGTIVMKYMMPGGGN